MAKIFKDRVKQLTTSPPGTGNFVFVTTPTGFQAFTAIGNANTFDYTAWDGAGNWETGEATYVSSGAQASRTAGLVYDGSAGAGVLTNFTGNVTVWCDIPAVIFSLYAPVQLTSGSGATFNCTTQFGSIPRALEVIRKGGGGGGGCTGGVSSAATAGGDTIFNVTSAKGGSPSTSSLGIGGAGGTGGTGTAIRTPGRAGGGSASCIFSGTTFIQLGGPGGGQGGGIETVNASGANGAAGAANSGGGGAGASIANGVQATVASSGAFAGGGGEGETASDWIIGPSNTITYTVGAAGAGAVSNSLNNGGNGGTGGIIVIPHF